MTHWTEQDEAILTRLWNAGQSGSQIAKVLRISRNAVIGKVHRLELPHRTAAKPINVAHIRKPVHRKPKLRAVVKPVAVVVAKPAVSQIALNVGLLDLTRTMCRWPTSGDKPHLFCGVECGEATYCAHHAAMAFTPRISKKLRVPTDRPDGKWQTVWMEAA
jgi:GcrA cell cycle regulator